MGCWRKEICHPKSKGKAVNKPNSLVQLLQNYLDSIDLIPTFLRVYRTPYPELSANRFQNADLEYCRIKAKIRQGYFPTWANFFLSLGFSASTCKIMRLAL